MFVKSAAFYDALYHFKNYPDACARLHRRIQTDRPGSSTLLDVGCGTGRHLAFLQEWYSVQGADLSDELLEVARERLPGVTFHQGDMVSFSAGGHFDVVTCLFSAIAYVRTAERMRAAIANMARHLHPGGLLIVEPWFTPDTVWSGHITSNYVDLPGLKIAWMYTTELKDLVTILDINYLVGTPASVEHFRERHELGVFRDAEYREAFELAGLTVAHDPNGLFARGLYVACKNGAVDPIESTSGDPGAAQT